MSIKNLINIFYNNPTNLSNSHKDLRIMSQPINKTIIAQNSIIEQKSSINDRKSINRQIEQHANSLKQSVLDSFEHLQYSHINFEQKWKVFFYEFMGMLFFIYGAVTIRNLKWVDVHIGCAVLIGVIISGPVSGANLNPAVTLCNVLKKQNKFKPNMIPIYYSAQFLGAMIALILGQLINDLNIQPLLPEQKTAIGCLQVVASQAIGTFILIFFILQISNPNTTFIDNQLSGYMFIVLFVHAGRRYAPSSHQCINSMVAFTFALVNAIENSTFQGLKYVPLWFAGDLLGTIIAVFFYEKLFQPNVEHMRKLRRQHQEKFYQDIVDQHHRQMIPELIQELDQK